MFSFYLPEGEDPLHYRGQVLDRLGQMLDIADSYGITFGHENEARIYGDSPERCLDLLESFHGRLRCVFDMGNFVLEGHDPWPKAYESLKPYLGWFHIKDALRAGAIVPAGKGEACIGQTLRDYRKSGSGSVFVTLEPHLQTFSGLNAIKGKTFDNLYKYPDQQTAFADAVKSLREVLA
jgi:sugar phosphate isomerase/epimerase